MEECHRKVMSSYAFRFNDKNLQFPGKDDRMHKCTAAPALYHRQDRIVPAQLTNSCATLNWRVNEYVPVRRPFSLDETCHL